jgi:predicted porin
MKKTIIAMALLGTALGAAQAQSSVTIYGSVDISYVKVTGQTVTMSGGAEREMVLGTASDNTYLGFKGQEDLGGGLKATFQLEHRLNLANGRSSMAGDFEGAANVGLSGAFGQLRFGRVNELATETYRRIDPFDQNGVAGMLTTPLRGNAFDGRLSYTARYDSPTFSGLNLGASYSVKNNTDALTAYPGAPNNGYAVSGTYTNGPIYLVANYNKAVNTTDSYNWNIGGSYAFGPAKLSLGYEDTRLKGFAEFKYETWFAGVSYRCGKGIFNASYSHMDAKGLADPDMGGTLKKYAVGYTHELSKRTSVYGNYAHAKISNAAFEDGRTSMSLFEAGINHKF